MKKVILLLFFVAATVMVQAQTHVKWSFSNSPIKNGECDLMFTADIEDGWYTYSQFLADGGPVPTSFSFNEGAHFTKVDKITETSDHKIDTHDEMFDMQIVKYKEKVVFTQHIKVVDASKPITGFLTYMSCNSQMCMPPKEVDFSFQLK